MRYLMLILPLVAFTCLPTGFAQSNVEFGKQANTDKPPSQSGEEEAKVITSIFKAMTPQKNAANKQIVSYTSQFTVRACQIPVHKWAQFALMGTPIHQNFIFKDGCDVQGALTITQTPFPLNLQIRNYQDFIRVRMQLVVTLTLDLQSQVAHISVKATDGLLSTKLDPRSTEFSGDYTFDIGIDGQMANNKGGNLKINRLKGHPASIDVPLIIN